MDECRFLGDDHTIRGTECLRRASQVLFRMKQIDPASASCMATYETPRIKPTKKKPMRRFRRGKKRETILFTTLIFFIKMTPRLHVIKIWSKLFPGQIILSMTATYWFLALNARHRNAHVKNSYRRVRGLGERGESGPSCNITSSKCLSKTENQKNTKQKKERKTYMKSFNEIIQSHLADLIWLGFGFMPGTLPMEPWRKPPK